MKKILNHLDFWDVKRKPSPCANGPPPESVILYDQSSAPSADDYLIDADHQIAAYLYKYPARSKVVSYARICLNAQFHLKKSILTTTLASVIKLGIGSF